MKIIAKFTVTWILATLLILACVVSAMGLSTEEPVPAPDPDATSTVYYISDNPLSSTYRQMLLNSGVVSNCVLKYYDTTVFMDSVSLLFYAGEVFADLHDAYVIFEMNYGFQREILESDQMPYVTSLLTALFSFLKQNNCEIMFICGTDESRFRRNDFNAFLDYVDIHVNTDIWQLFISNVFYLASDESLEDPFYGTTLILDATFSMDEHIDWDRHWFIREYLRTYLRSRYHDWISAHPGLTTKQIMAHPDINIKVLCHTEGKTFYDIIQDEYIDTDDQEFLHSIENDRIFATGRTRSGTAYPEEWIELMLGIRSDYQINFPIYIYNADHYTCAKYNATDVYLSGGPTGMVNIMINFVSGANMNPYNNYTGRCVVTHKPLQQGPNGWMHDLGEDYDIYGWDIFMYRENHECYFRDEENSIITLSSLSGD